MRSKSTLYERILGEHFSALPIAVQTLHSVQCSLIAKGSCSVEQGRSPFSRIISWIIGFPDSGSDLPIQVVISVNNKTETWTRTIGTSKFSSQLTDGIFRSNKCLLEKFGFLEFYFFLPVTNKSLDMQLLQVTIFGMPIPKWTWPLVKAKETVREGKFHFDVKVSLPIIGLLTYYQGYLDIEVQE